MIIMISTGTICHHTIDSLPIAPPSQSTFPLKTTNLFSVIYNFCFIFFIPLFCFLGSIYKWNQAEFVFLSLAYFIWHNTFMVHLCCLKWQDGLHFLRLSSIPLYVCECVCVSMDTYVSMGIPYIDY